MMKKLWPHARPYAKWICVGVACSALEAVFELLIPLVMSDIVDALPPETRTLSYARAD